MPGVERILDTNLNIDLVIAKSHSSLPRFISKNASIILGRKPDFISVPALNLRELVWETQEK